MKAINFNDRLVLVQFYDSELSQLQEWWFPLQSLSILKHSQSIHCGLNQLGELVVDTSLKLASRYASSIILNILKESDLSQMENLALFLKLCASEYLSSIDIFQSKRLMLRDTLHDLEFTDPQHPALFMNRLKERLQNYIKSTQNSEQVSFCFKNPKVTI